MRGFIVSIFLLIATPLVAQTVDDTVSYTIDSAALEEVTDEEREIVYTAAPDSSAVSAKRFDEQKISELKSNPELSYKEPPTVAESLWDRFWAWIGEILSSLFKSAIYTNWGNVLMYILGLALIIILVMMVLKVNAFKVLYTATGASQTGGIEENIHEMDFDKLIKETLANEDYRRGVRLLFLYALKILSDKHLIEWESGKTNHEYVGELKNTELKKGLNELSFYFDYAWYGNFRITEDTFNKAQNIFQLWKTRIN